MSRGIKRRSVGIDVDEACAVSVIDILWNSKCEGELAVLNLVGSVIKGVLSVCEDKGGISTFACGVIQFALDSFLSIAYHCIQGSREIVCFAASKFDVSLNANYVACPKLWQTIAFHGYAIDVINNSGVCR